MSLAILQYDNFAEAGSLPREDLPGEPSNATRAVALRDSAALNLPGPAEGEVDADADADKPPLSAKQRKYLKRKADLKKAHGKKRREREKVSGVVRLSLRDAFRTTFAHRAGFYETFAALVLELRQFPPLLPPSHSLTSQLTIFPSMFATPSAVPVIMQARFSQHRFFFANSCIYHKRLGQILYIMPRAWFAAGNLNELFSPQKENRCEMFWRNPSTRHIHYLGIFRLVNTALFPYSFSVCGNVPELDEAPVKPKRGHDQTLYAFAVLQFVGWNGELYDICAPAPVQSTD